MTQVEKMWKSIKNFKWDKTNGSYALNCNEWLALAECGNKLEVSSETYKYGFIKGMRYQKAQEKKKRKAGKA